MHYITDEVKCAICDYTWVAIYNLITEKLECPKCGVLNDSIDAGEYDKEKEM